MEISERLKAVAAFVKTSRTIADIGTDHGYVPIYLCRNGTIDRAIACDINREPVERAKYNIAVFGLRSRIETRLGSGFAPVGKGETEGAVIAGMGGMLMIEILSEARDKVGALKEIVLQPQTDIDRVRRYVHRLDMKIADENMVYEDGIFYTIIRAVPGIETYNREIDYIFGKINIEKKSPVLRAYINKLMEKNKNIADRLQRAETENAQKRLAEITYFDDICKEVIECLSSAEK